MKLPICAFLLVAIASDVLAANINPYIPVVIVPKTPIIKCPSSCSSARDCFFVHPLSENHFYSCFHGKAMVHQCPTGKSFSDDKHQCVVESQNMGSLSDAKVAKLTEKIVVFENLIDKFQKKMEKVQKVIIESDNKIGLLGKFLLKALKNNRENYCNKGESNSAKIPETPNIIAEPVVKPAQHDMEFEPIEEVGKDDSMMPYQNGFGMPVESAKMPNSEPVEARPKNGTSAKNDDAGDVAVDLPELLPAKENQLEESPVKETKENTSVESEKGEVKSEEKTEPTTP